jgi:hypothetical protein
MRGKEANAGSLRALLLILALLLANLTATCLRQPGRGAAQLQDSVVVERTTSLGKVARAHELAALDARRFADARHNSSAALGITEEQRR